MISIVIPMAGLGSRFGESEEGAPKPMIEVVPGRRMIDFVVDYLRLPVSHRFVFVGLDEHDRAFDYLGYFADKGIDYDVVLTPHLTRGPATTALLALDKVDAGDELLIAYCDCFLTIDIMAFVAGMRRREADGGVLTYPSDSPFESYAQIDAEARVTRTAEKEIISPHATAGLYYFARAGDYFSAATAFAASSGDGAPDLFVCPVYNLLIDRGLSVYAQPIAREDIVEMGTPVHLARSRRRLAEEAIRKSPGGAA